ncbi:hypothetical protein NDI85_16390 [Halomicroarcula sp. S1AR25-4]|uniref:hypothetical protein n=1 Tax=Haloarcula sp. S1AR25-4 TaxID=2950538 RepID=UPI0028751A95|nr:hypothetical protein [Halomicroarcula sp. S1AR25-4]MDS0279381.1 hypothetical protein [Halomicroarcula sp. S1AR25-4]
MFPKLPTSVRSRYFGYFLAAIFATLFVGSLFVASLLLMGIFVPASVPTFLFFVLLASIYAITFSGALSFAQPSIDRSDYLPIFVILVVFLAMALISQGIGVLTGIEQGDNLATVIVALFTIGLASSLFVGGWLHGKLRITEKGLLRYLEPVETKGIRETLTEIYSRRDINSLTVILLVDFVVSSVIGYAFDIGVGLATFFGLLTLIRFIVEFDEQKLAEFNG